MSGTTAPERDVEMPDASAFSTGAEGHEQNENNMAISSNRMNEDRGSEPVRQNDSGEDDGLVLMDNRKQYAVSIRWEQSQGDEVARRQEFLGLVKSTRADVFAARNVVIDPDRVVVLSRILMDYAVGLVVQGGA
eukprot:CAMPEP_0171311432 /NCGR_PEP_ID=MMETSP0816-20121228/21687_1 /TAXON_ID=420281 /ORGANISM="Proboscia inermis, Strain CCAP1064/1" /LENGTH=133 /DNA_ID=CAMNT_0011796209 /DNA_START=76 /DNA_END=478 /DNA_ORIENTATION=+